MLKNNGLIEKIKNVRVLVIGDVMLDRYHYGTVTRISPEAPVPIVNINKTTEVAGGAANVALNIAGLGAQPYLIGLIGTDLEGDLFKKVLSGNSLPVENLIADPNRKTTVKTRIVGHHQHIVRMDQESVETPDQEIEKRICASIEKLLPDSDIIIISDYAKGTLNKNILNKAIKKAKEKNIQVLVDPKGKDYSIYKGATLLTPNKREAAEATGLNENLENLIEKAGEIILHQIELDSLVITQGEQGMTLFNRDCQPTHLNAVSRDVFDVTGAGDTVIATLAVALSVGYNLQEAAELANMAAGIVVEHFGTTAIKISELAELSGKAE